MAVARRRPGWRQIKFKLNHDWRSGAVRRGAASTHASAPTRGSGRPARLGMPTAAIRAGEPMPTATLAVPGGRQPEHMMPKSLSLKTGQLKALVSRLRVS